MTKNILAIDVSAIKERTNRRIELLTSTGNIIGTRIGRIVRDMTSASSFYKDLARHWDKLDPEGRENLPEGVDSVMRSAKDSAARLDHLLGWSSGNDKVTGLRDCLPYDQNKIISNQSPYTIKVAMQPGMSADNLADTMQSYYDEGGPAGSFKVEAIDLPTHRDWVWVTFERELGEDSDYIAERMAESNFAVPAGLAAAQQLATEFREVSHKDDPVANMLLQALEKAEVRFPPPPLTQAQVEATAELPLPPAEVHVDLS